jgi:hypothetical protein
VLVRPWSVEQRLSLLDEMPKASRAIMSKITDRLRQMDLG